MKILKRPDNIIFDTENPNQMEFNPTPLKLATPLHQVILKAEWEFLYEYFKTIESVKHPIFKDFNNSFYYCLEV